MSAAPVYVALEADTTRLMTAMEEAVRLAGREFDRHRMQLVVQVDVIRDLERAEQLVDVIRAGTWGRWFVRGALDPAYAEPSQRDLAAQVLAHRGHHDAAGALLAGWVTRHAWAPAGPLAWHRLIGDTAVEVGAA